MIDNSRTVNDMNAKKNPESVDRAYEQCDTAVQTAFEALGATEQELAMPQGLKERFDAVISGCREAESRKLTLRKRLYRYVAAGAAAALVAGVWLYPTGQPATVADAGSVSTFIETGIADETVSLESVVNSTLGYAQRLTVTIGESPSNPEECELMVLGALEILSNNMHLASNSLVVAEQQFATADDMINNMLKLNIYEN